MLLCAVVRSLISNRSGLSRRGDSFVPGNDPCSSSRIDTSSPTSKAQRVSSRAAPPSPGPNDSRGTQRVSEPCAALCAHTKTAARSWDPEATAALFHLIVVYNPCTRPRHRESGGAGPWSGDHHEQRTSRHTCKAFPHAHFTRSPLVVHGTICIRVRIFFSAQSRLGCVSMASTTRDIRRCLYRRSPVCYSPQAGCTVSGRDMCARD